MRARFYFFLENVFNTCRRVLKQYTRMYTCIKIRITVETNVSKTRQNNLRIGRNTSKFQSL